MIQTTIGVESREKEVTDSWTGGRMFIKGHTDSEPASWNSRLELPDSNQDSLPRK